MSMASMALRTRRASLALLLAVVGGLQSCATPTVAPDNYLHMICVDKDGSAAPLSVRGGTQRGAAPLDLHVRNIAQNYWYECIESGTYPCFKKVAFVIHGGLVSMSNSVDEAEKAIAPMQAVARSKKGSDSQSHSVYPIFINWETGMGASYVDHLFGVRSGRHEPPWKTWPSSPFILSMDVGRAVTRMIPLLVTEQYPNIRATYFSQRPEPVPGGWERSVWIDTRDQERGFWSTLGTACLEFAPGLARIVSTPLLDTVGYSAYGNMLRRARVLFLRDEDFDGGQYRPTGALSLLMHHLLHQSNHKQQSINYLLRKLRIERAGLKDGTTEAGVVDQKIKVAESILASNDYGHQGVPFANVGEPTFEIMAHSMGTHVANSLVRRFGHEATFDKIVFMGAVCTIREFSDTTLPYVVKNPLCRFYNVCLHPGNEIGEWTGYGLLPHGSLLVWIDSFITDIRSELDYTMGSWNNIMRALPIMAFLTADVRERIQIRGLGRYGKVPQRHGQLNDLEFKYWSKEFFDPHADHRTKWLAKQQAEDYGLGRAEAVRLDSLRNELQRSFDEKLAHARSKSEVAKLLELYSYEAKGIAAKESSGESQLNVEKLIDFWIEQSAQRIKDLGINPKLRSGIGGAGCSGVGQ